MFNVTVEVCTATQTMAGRWSIRDFERERLSDALASAMLASDQCVAEAISLAPLLVDVLAVRYRVRPSVPRDKLAVAWIDAVACLAQVVQVLPEDPGDVSQRHPDKPSPDPLTCIAENAGPSPVKRRSSRKKGGATNGQA